MEGHKLASVILPLSAVQVEVVSALPVKQPKEFGKDGLFISMPADNVVPLYYHCYLCSIS